jgi:hypothetical protein
VCEREKLSANAQRLGVRWQGGSRDTAFARTAGFRTKKIFRAVESGVALRFPPQSKTLRVGEIF